MTDIRLEFWVIIIGSKIPGTMPSPMVLFSEEAANDMISRVGGQSYIIHGPEKFVRDVQIA